MKLTLDSNKNNHNHNSYFGFRFIQITTHSFTDMKDGIIGIVASIDLEEGKLNYTKIAWLTIDGSQIFTNWQTSFFILTKKDQKTFQPVTSFQNKHFLPLTNKVFYCCWELTLRLKKLFLARNWLQLGKK